MNIKKYSSNLVSVAHDRPIFILSANKKDAVKLVKLIKGITIGQSFDSGKLKEGVTYDEMMNKQQELLKKAFEKGLVKIKE